MSSSNALRTVSPPKPESKTPMMGRRADIMAASFQMIAARKARSGDQNCSKDRAYAFVERDATEESPAVRPQHGPGGIGAPCGQVRGCPRNVQILSVASGDRMCSNLHACCSISDSLSIARLSV